MAGGAAKFEGVGENGLVKWSLSDSETRGFVESAILAVVLPAVAGAVNGIGFLAVGAYTSHVSGVVARVGDEIALGHWSMAFAAASLVFSFLAGAITTTVLIETARRRARAKYSRALLLEVGVILAFGLMVWSLQPLGETARLILTGALAFAMGSQNALVTRISGAVVRTTHLTGVITDLAIESVKGAMWLKDRLYSMPPRDWAALLPLASKDPELRKLRWHMTLIASFVFGAIAGPALYLTTGVSALLVPAGVLALLALFDRILGFQGRPSLAEQKISVVAPVALPPSAEVVAGEVAAVAVKVEKPGSGGSPPAG